MLKLKDVLVDVSTANATVHLHLHVVAKCEAHFLSLLCELSCRREDQDLWFPQLWVDGLQGSDCEDTSFTCS